MTTMRYINTNKIRMERRQPKNRNVVKESPLLPLKINSKIKGSMSNRDKTLKKMMIITRTAWIPYLLMSTNMKTKSSILSTTIMTMKIRIKTKTKTNINSSIRHLNTNRTHLTNYMSSKTKSIRPTTVTTSILAQTTRT